jgi:hypothetical protein
MRAAAPLAALLPSPLVWEGNVKRGPARSVSNPAPMRYLRSLLHGQAARSGTS